MTRAKKTATVHLARLPFAGYELTAIGSTPEIARRLVEKKAKAALKMDRYVGDPRPHGSAESLWDYMGGSVLDIVLDGEAQWL